MKRLGYVARHVTNLAASVDFYQWAGMTALPREKGSDAAWLVSEGREDGVGLALIPDAIDERQQLVTDVTRIGISLPSRDLLNQRYEEAAHMGGSPSEGRIRQQREINGKGNRANFRVTDPDGHVVELWHDEENQPQYPAFTNLTLGPQDMARSADFYNRWCDLAVSHFGQVSQSCRMTALGEEKGFQVVLCDDALHPQNNPDWDLTHVGVLVDSKEELEALYVDAEEANIINRPLITRKQSLYLVGSFNPRAVPSFTIRDPDNYIIGYRVRPSSLDCEGS